MIRDTESLPAKETQNRLRFFIWKKRQLTGNRRKIYKIMNGGEKVNRDLINCHLSKYRN